MITPLREDRAPTSRRSLVVFAPYPPAKNGIADYVAELMPYHMTEFDVTLVVADDAPIPSDTGPRVLLASEFRRHRTHFESALKLYHIGNNPHHCYMLDILGRDPGIVVLHDFNLCYMHEMGSLRWGNERRHMAAMEREYGALGRDILDWQLKNEYRELFAGYELPLNGDVLENATAIVTHSRQVQYRVAARVPQKPVWYVPHHLAPRAADYSTLSRREARSQLGLPQNEIIVTAVGFVTRAKQIPMTLAALSSLRGQVASFRFVLAGERRPDEYDVDADIANSGLAGLVTCTDYLDEEHFFKHLAAADIVVNLRYPSGGEMSGTLVRALGLGLPTLVLDHGPMGELPDSVVRKIAWDSNTQSVLTESLRELMTDDYVRLQLGSSAAEYVRRKHNIVAVSRQYSRILLSSEGERAREAGPLRLHFPHPVAVARKLRQMGERGRSAVRSVDGRTWWAVPSTPLGSDGVHAALVVSPDCKNTAALLSDVFEWSPGAVTAITPEEFLGSRILGPDGTSLAASRFAFALVVVPAHMEEAFAALLMRRLNAAVRRDAGVCLETWAPFTAGDDADALLGRMQLSRRLRDAGFGMVHEWSPQEGLVSALVTGSFEEHDTREYACVTARKVSDYAVWRFADTPEGLPLRCGGRIGQAMRT
jgi:glycosyltransferase involved in cell wall biosynthesis